MSVDLKKLNSISVLYVEDDDLIRNQTKSMFDNLFREVFVAENGQAGLDLFVANKDLIDVVVSDINMPIMDGLSMSASIREIDYDRPIVLTTAFTDEEFLIRSMEVNIDKYVTKPVKIKELATAILEVVQKWKKTHAVLPEPTKTVDIIQEQLNMDNAFEVTQNELSEANALLNDYVSWFKVDKMGGLYWASNKFLTLFELDADEIFGLEISNIKDFSVEGVSFQKQMFEVIYTKKANCANHKFKLKSGKTIECLTTVVPIYDCDNEIDSYNFYQDLMHIC